MAQNILETTAVFHKACSQFELVLFRNENPFIDRRSYHISHSHRSENSSSLQPADHTRS